VQHEVRLEISPRAINGLIALCEANGLSAVVCHSHPFDAPYSPSDDHGERRIYRTLQQFLPAAVPMASLLFLPEGIQGRVWVPGQKDALPFEEIVVVGRYIRRIQLGSPAANPPTQDFGRYDRQVRAFGSEGQQAISAARVAVVGVGGTGSPTAEQLVRLGVRDLVLVDPDDVDRTSTTRMYGSFEHTTRKLWPFGRRQPSKVAALAEHLRRINVAVDIRPIRRSVVSDDAVRCLIDRDFIFLCTDDHWGRSIVNQLSYQYLIPAINMGMRITSDHGAIEAAAGSVDVLRTGLPCLWCRQSLDAGRIAAESMPKPARISLQSEGYVEDIDTPAPSVISITTTLSGLAVTLFLQLLTDFMGPSGDVHRLNYQILDGIVRRGRCTILDQCICRRVSACGDQRPLGTIVSD